MNRLLLVLCLCLHVPAFAGRTVAVLTFDVDSVVPSHAPLGHGLANMLVTDLARTGSMQVVERDRMQALLGELALQHSGVVDPATAQELGRIVGASHLLVGGITVSDGRMRLDGRLVSVETGLVEQTAETEGASDAFFELEEELVRELIRSMRSRVSLRNRLAFNLRIGAGSAEALAYGRAVMAADRGDRLGAAEEVERVGEQRPWLKKQFLADLQPQAPLYLVAHVGGSAREAVLPGAEPDVGVVMGLQAGWAASDRFGVDVGVVRGVTSSRKIEIPAAFQAIKESLAVHEVRLGAHLRVARLGIGSLALSASGGLGAGSLDMTASQGGQPTLLVRAPVTAATVGLGARFLLISHERIGVLATAHATNRFMRIEATDGLSAGGASMRPGGEVWIGYIAYVGHR